MILEAIAHYINTHCPSYTAYIRSNNQGPKNIGTTTSEADLPTYNIYISDNIIKIIKYMPLDTGTPTIIIDVYACDLHDPECFIKVSKLLNRIPPQ